MSLRDKKAQYQKTSSVNFMDPVPMEDEFCELLSIDSVYSDLF